MDTGLNVRPVQAPATTPLRLQPAPERQIARTELPATQSVQAPEKSDFPPYNRDDAQIKLRAEINSAFEARIAEPNRKVERDEITQELVFRKLSAETGLVVSQFPDEAILRQRAYTVQQRRAELDASLGVNPDAAKVKIA